MDYKQHTRGGRIMGRLRRVKIRYRLLAVFLLISLAPSLFIGMFAYRQYTKSVNDKLYQVYEQAVYLIQRNFLSQMNEYRDYISRVSINREFRMVMAREPKQRTQPDEVSIIEMRNIIDKIPFQSIYLKNLRILDRNHNIIYDLGYDDIAENQFEQLLDRMDGASPEDIIQYIRTYRGANKVALGRKLYTAEATGVHVGYILAYIDEKAISDGAFSNVSFGDGSNIMLLDHFGNVISAQDKRMLGMSLAEDDIFKFAQSNREENSAGSHMEIDGIPYLVVSSYNRELDMYVAATVPYSYITDETRRINTSMTAVGGILILLCLCATFLVYASIMQPINQITSVCDMSSDEDLRRSIHDTSGDELGMLSQHLDQMRTEIRQLGILREEEQIRKRQLELEMLQYQINPHFLFNTLSSLKYLARINDVPVLEQALASFTSLLQHTLISKKGVVSIANEIENLEHYFNIQTIRYGGAFTVEYEIEPESLAYTVPRFVLQPLAENAIIHGLSAGTPIITICVSSRCVGGQYVELLVQDNGCGFDASLAPAGSSEHFSGIGTSNVDQRIRLEYGPEYGLEICSTPGEGTVCRIKIPM